MMLRLTKTTVLAGALSIAAAAGASASTVLNYDISGNASVTFSVKQDANQERGYRTLGSLGFQIDDFFGEERDLTFNSLSNGGGLKFFASEDGDDAISAAGEVLYTGNTSMPTLRTGSFTLFDNEQNSYRLSVTAQPSTPQVPLPAAGFMLLAGLAGLGLVRVRK